MRRRSENLENPVAAFSLTFVEKWQSLDALKEHMASEHFQLFGSETEDFVENMDIQVIGADELNL